jgi:PAS domain S-box-containing protein
MQRMNRDSRIAEILKQIVRFSKGDYSGYVPVSGQVDEIDAISAGLNVLGEILNAPLLARANNADSRRDQLAGTQSLSGEQLSNEDIGIFDIAPDAIVVVDDKGIIKQWNPSAVKMFGWRTEEIVGESIYETIIPQRYRKSHTARLTSLVDADRHALLNPSFTSVHFPARCKGGGEIELEIKIALIVTNGEPRFAAFLRHAVAAQFSELNSSLRKSLVRQQITFPKAATKYRALFQKNPMPMWIIDASSLKFLEVNASAISHYGYTRDEFLSMTTVDIRPEADRERYRNLDRALGSQNRGVWTHVKKDGSLVFVEVLVHEITFEDKLAKLIVAIDVTKRKMAEESLEFSENRFHKIFHSKLIGFFIWDSAFRVLQANDVFLNMLGFSATELSEKTIDLNTFAPEEFVLRDLASVGQEDFASMADPFEAQLITKDKRHISVFIGTASIDRELFVSYVMDISQQKKMAKEIMELNKNLEKRVEERTAQLLAANLELESFTYTVSHDLRTPLRAIHGYSQLLADDYASVLDSNGIKTLSHIRSNAKRMGQLIDDLLAFSRVGRRELNKVPIEINRLVDNVFNNLRDQDLDKVSVNVHDLGNALVDSELVQLVFHNLIANAIKYSSKKTHPTIEIGLEATHNGLAYFVKDNGAGFDMKYYDKLFGVFNRLHSDDEYDGTGVGLAIVHRIITRHGGKVWAFGNVDEGATFYFTLNQHSIQV